MQAIKAESHPTGASSKPPSRAPSPKQSSRTVQAIATVSVDTGLKPLAHVGSAGKLNIVTAAVPAPATSAAPVAEAAKPIVAEKKEDEVPTDEEDDDQIGLHGYRGLVFDFILLQVLQSRPGLATRA